MRYYTTVREFKVDQFDVIVDWTYEDCSVRDCFDETEEEFLEMERRQEAHLDTHYIARVRAMYDGVEMGVDHLGSCYARDCSPEDDINDGIGCLSAPTRFKTMAYTVQTSLCAALMALCWTRPCASSPRYSPHDSP